MPWTFVIQNILFSCISRAKVRCHTEATRYCNSTILSNGNNWSCGFVLCSYMNSNVISDFVTSAPAPLMHKNPQRCKINHCLIGYNTVESPKIFQGLIYQRITSKVGGPRCVILHVVVRMLHKPRQSLVSFYRGLLLTTIQMHVGVRKQGET